MPNWQPIDTAPKDGTPVLLYLNDADQMQYHALGRILVGHWDDHPRCRCWIAGGYMRRVFPPTHWAPLPEPPANA